LEIDTHYAIYDASLPWKRVAVFMLRGYSGSPLQKAYGITASFLRPPGAVINTADKKRGNFLSIFWVVKLKKVSNTVMGGLFSRHGK